MHYIAQYLDAGSVSVCACVWNQQLLLSEMILVCVPISASACGLALMFAHCRA